MLSIFSIKNLRDNGMLGLSGVMAMLSAITATLIAMYVVLGLFTYVIALLPIVPPGQWSFIGINLNKPGTLDVKTCTSSSSSPDYCTVTTRPMTEEEMTPSLENVSMNLASSAVTLVPLGILSWGLFQATFCFLNLSRRIFFSYRTVRGLRNFSLSNLFFVLFFPHVDWISTRIGNLIGSVASHLRTIQNGAPTAVAFSTAQGQFNVEGLTGLDLSILVMIVYAVALTIIADVMMKASVIVDDHSQIV
jgi:hypothetical protein